MVAVKVGPQGLAELAVDWQVPMAPHLGLLAPMEKVERHPQVVLADFIQAMVSQRCQARLE